MKYRGRMFQLTVLADRRSLAVTLGFRTVDAECGNSFFRQQLAELLADCNEGREILDVFSRKRIFDHGDRGRAPGRRRDFLPHLQMGFLDHRDDFANDRAHLYQPRSRSSMHHALYRISMKRPRLARFDGRRSHDDGLAE